MVTIFFSDNNKANLIKIQGEIVRSAQLLIANDTTQMRLLHCDTRLLPFMNPRSMLVTELELNLFGMDAVFDNDTLSAFPNVQSLSLIFPNGIRMINGSKNVFPDSQKALKILKGKFSFLPKLPPGLELETLTVENTDLSDLSNLPLSNLKKLKVTLYLSYFYHQ